MDTLVIDLPSVEEAQYARRYGERIGVGAYRTVYRLPGSKWAYKFESNNYWSSGANNREMFNYRTRRGTLPEEIDFPEMHMLSDGTIAAEFVNGTLAREAHTGYGYNMVCNCESLRAVKCWQKAVDVLNMQDLHGRNVMIRKDGKIMIIDIGEYGDETSEDYVSGIDMTPKRR